VDDDIVGEDDVQILPLLGLTTMIAESSMAMRKQTLVDMRICNDTKDLHQGK